MLIFYSPFDKGEDIFNAELVLIIPELATSQNLKGELQKFLLHQYLQKLPFTDFQHEILFSLYNMFFIRDLFTVNCYTALFY